MEFRLVKFDKYAADIKEYHIERFLETYKEEYIKYQEYRERYKKGDRNIRDELIELRVRVYAYKTALLKLGYEIEMIEDEPKK